MAAPIRFDQTPNYWTVSDERWETIRAFLAAHDPPHSAGRRRVDQRAALDAVIYIARTSCRWNNLPPHLPDDSSVNRTYKRWVKRGLFAQLWQLVVAPGDDAQPGAQETRPGVDVPAAPTSGVRTVAAAPAADRAA